MTEAAARRPAAPVVGERAGLAARLKRLAGTRSGVLLAFAAGAVAAFALPPFHLLPLLLLSVPAAGLAGRRGVGPCARRVARLPVRARPSHGRSLLDLPFAADRSVAAWLVDPDLRRRAGRDPGGLRRPGRGRRPRPAQARAPCRCCCASAHFGWWASGCAAGSSPAFPGTCSARSGWSRTRSRSSRR